MPERPPVLGQQPATERKPKAFGPSDKLRASVRWRSVRLAILRKAPLCQSIWCRDQVTPAMEVHHIEPLSHRPDLAYVAANLAALCVACHGKISGYERRGKPTRQFIVRVGQ